MQKLPICFLLIFIGSLIFPREIVLKSKDSFSSVLTIDNIIPKEITKSITDESHIPVWTTFYQIVDGKDITVGLSKWDRDEASEGVY